MIGAAAVTWPGTASLRAVLVIPTLSLIVGAGPRADLDTRRNSRLNPPINVNDCSNKISLPCHKREHEKTAAKLC